MKKYLIIYHDLLDNIQSGEYRKGDLLPSDAKLVMDYRVSRETVRRAIRLLANEGYIQTVKGKGSFVLNSERLNFPISKIESYQEVIKENGIKSLTELLEIKKHVDVPNDLLQDNPPMEATLIIRRRWVEDSPVIIDYDYVNERIVPDLPADEAKKSLLAYFEKTLGLTVDYAVKTMTIEPSDYDDRRLLKLEKQIPIVVVRSETHLSDNRLLWYTESRHRADKFRSHEFSRRRMD